MCICVHAEQNCLITAARFGNSIAGSIAYSTMRPCFDCTKAMLQAKVHTIYYLHDWSHPVEDLHEQYELMQNKFEGGVRQLKMADPKSEWANSPSELRVIEPAKQTVEKAESTSSKKKHSKSK